MWKNWEQHSDMYEIWMRLEIHCVWYCWIGVSVSESAYLTQFVTFKEGVEGWQRLSRVQHTQHRCRYNPPCGHGTALPHLSCSHRGPSNCLHLRTQSRQNRYRCCRSAHVWNMLDMMTMIETCFGHCVWISKYVFALFWRCLLSDFFKTPHEPKGWQNRNILSGADTSSSCQAASPHGRRTFQKNMARQGPIDLKVDTVSRQ